MPAAIVVVFDADAGRMASLRALAEALADGHVSRSRSGMGFELGIVTFSSHELARATPDVWRARLRALLADGGRVAWLTRHAFCWELAWVEREVLAPLLLDAPLDALEVAELMVVAPG